MNIFSSKVLETCYPEMWRGKDDLQRLTIEKGKLIYQFSPRNIKFLLYAYYSRKQVLTKRHYMYLHGVYNVIERAKRKRYRIISNISENEPMLWILVQLVGHTTHCDGIILSGVPLFPGPLPYTRERCNENGLNMVAQMVPMRWQCTSWVTGDCIGSPGGPGFMIQEHRYVRIIMLIITMYTYRNTRI